MQIVALLLNLYVFALIGRALLSWFPISYESPVRPVADFLHAITEPVLAPVRGVLPPLGGIDLSTIVVIVGIRVIQGALPGI